MSHRLILIKSDETRHRYEYQEVGITGDRLGICLHSIMHMRCTLVVGTNQMVNLMIEFDMRKGKKIRTDSRLLV